MTAPRRTLSLATRLGAIGLLQLALLGVASVIISWTVRPSPHPRDVRLLIETAAVSVEPALGRGRAALAEVLAETADQLDLELSLYDKDDKLVASTVTPALPVEPAADDEPPPPMGRPPGGAGGAPPPLWSSPWLTREGPPRRPIPIAVGSEGALLIARGAPPRPFFVAPLLTLLAGVVVLGAGAYLNGRWMIQPLEALASAAKKVGTGDLTVRTRLDRGDEIGMVAGAFDEMAGRLELLMRAERELLANVSHELRTPLARIRVAMELGDEGDGETARLAMSEIATDLAELESIVSDILVASRFELSAPSVSGIGMLLGSMRQTPPEEIAAQSERRFRARHADRELRVTVAEGLPSVIVDPVLFRRVIDNLLENAHKYSPDLGTAIELDVGARGDEVIFEVRDHGAGIAQEDQARVFDPFFRAERSRTRDAGGVGLGLTLAQRITAAHEGSITLDSELGEGTTVHVRLPAAR